MFKFNYIHCLAWRCRTIIIIIKANTADWWCLCIRVIKIIIKITAQVFLNPCMAFCKIFFACIGCHEWGEWIKSNSHVCLCMLWNFFYSFHVMYLAVMLCNSCQEFKTFVINKNKQTKPKHVHGSKLIAQISIISSVFSNYFMYPYIAIQTETALEAQEF